MTPFLIIIFSLLIIYVALQLWVWKKFMDGFQIEIEPNQQLPDVHKIPYETLYVPTENNKTVIAWLLKNPKTKPNDPIVIVGHGWTRNATFLWPISYGLYVKGYTVLAINARNHGESELDPPMSVEKYAQDLDHFAEVFHELYPNHPMYVIGHSLGASAALIHASRNPWLKKVVSICGFSSSREIFLMDLKKAKVPYFPFGFMVLKMIEWIYHIDYIKLEPNNFISKIKGDILLIYSEKDARIPKYMQDDLMAHASQENKPRMAMIPNATHTSLLTDELTLRTIVRFFDNEKS